MEIKNLLVFFQVILLLRDTHSSDLSPTHAYSFDTKLSESKINKIIAGVDAFPGEFPWQVSLQVTRNPAQESFHFCGASILDNRRILTAAHCLADFESSTDDDGSRFLQVHAGIHNIRSSSFNRRGVQVSSVKRMIIHPDFNKNNADNDLAVLLLSIPLNITSRNYIRPLRLPPLGHEPQGTCVVSGWGFQTPQNGEFDRFSDKLQKTSVDIVDRSRCSEIYNEVNPVTENMICAGRLKEGMATCIGDSGSPVVCYDLNDINLPYLAGIVSWGINPCGLSNYPSVFSNVASLRKFIDSVPKS